MTLRDALVAYSRFYECLLPYRHSFVVGEFEQVTHDFGLLIRQLNARFGTSFAEFVHSEANVRECLELIKLRGTLSKTLFGFESGEVSREQLEREVQSVGGAKLLDARDVWDTKDAWVPSEDRTRAQTALREQWLQQPSLAKLRERAQLVYQAHVDRT